MTRLRHTVCFVASFACVFSLGTFTYAAPGDTELLRSGFENQLTDWSSVVGSVPTTFAGDMLGTTAGKYSREYGAGDSEQPSGSLVSFDIDSLGQREPMVVPTPGARPRFVLDSSRNPGGVSQLADLYDPPAPLEGYEGLVTGLAIDASGVLWASTCDGECSDSPSRLLRVNLDTMEVLDLGPILDQDGEPLTSVADLAIQPGTDVLFAGTDLGNCGDGDCLYMLSKTTARATLVGEINTPWLGGIAFTQDGTLYMVPAAPPNFDNALNREMLVLNPTTAAVLQVEPILLEQHYEVRRTSGSVLNIRTASFQALGADPQGRLIACWAFGGMTLWRRERGVVKDMFGDVVTGEQQWVWKLLGDGGEHIGDIAFR